MQWHELAAFPCELVLSRRPLGARRPSETSAGARDALGQIDALRELSRRRDTRFRRNELKAGGAGEVGAVISTCDDGDQMPGPPAS